MITRVFMLIRRGITDQTPVCVFPWEKPILEEIHGSNAEEVSIDQLCELKGAVKIKKVKLRHKDAAEGMSMREQYEAMVQVDPERNPLADPEAEYERLGARYGMHVKVALPNVEKVYGSFGNFRQAMKEYASGRTPGFRDESGPIEAEEKPLAEMTDKEVREVLKGRGVDIPKKASREALEELYVETVAA